MRINPKPETIAMAERVGFEPTIPLRVCRISSAVLSTTQPPLRSHWSALCGAGCLIAATPPPCKSEYDGFFQKSRGRFNFPVRIMSKVSVAVARQGRQTKEVCKIVPGSCLGSIYRSAQDWIFSPRRTAITHGLGSVVRTEALSGTPRNET